MGSVSSFFSSFHRDRWMVFSVASIFFLLEEVLVLLAFACLGDARPR